MIEIYHRVSPPCTYCLKAKALVENRFLDHKLYEIGKDISREELMAKFPRAQSVPVVVVGGEWIGGYTELHKHLHS